MYIKKLLHRDASSINLELNRWPLNRNWIESWGAKRFPPLISAVAMNIQVEEIMRKLLVELSYHYPYPDFNFYTSYVWPPIV